MNESKPSDDASLALKCCQNWSRARTPGSAGKEPVYGPGGSRCIGGMNSIQALVRNVRTSFWMRREMTSGRHHEEEYRGQSEGRGRS
jgi:hypothetical protein